MARKTGCATVVNQGPGLESVAHDVADRDRTQGDNQMQAIVQATPDVSAVISATDATALGPSPRGSKPASSTA